jgi:chromosome segregation ATPase
VSVRDI